MATEIISNTLTTQYLLDRDDNLIVATTGSLIVDTGDAIRTRTNLDTDTSVTILGRVEATGLYDTGFLVSAVFFDDTLASGQIGHSKNSVTIGAAGLVESLMGFGIFSLGGATQVSNFGSIEAFFGIALRNAGDFILNAGTISATDTGIATSSTDVVLKADRSLIQNDGAISVSAGFGIFTTDQWVTIVNSGTIDAKTGIVIQGQHSSVVNMGTITASTSSAVDCSFGSGTLTNTGTLVSLSNNPVITANDLAIFNSGTIDGGLYAIVGSVRSVTNEGTIVGDFEGISVWSGEKFRLVNSGLIEGDFYGVNHSMGQRSHIINFGTIVGGALGNFPAYSIFTGQVFAQVDNQGTLQGNVHVEGGKLSNSGSIAGDVTLGIGKLINNGVIDGDVFLLDSSTFFSGSNGNVTGNINGSYGADRLDGGDLSDRIFGNDSADTISGGAGDDFLSGGLGQDRLTGGSGADLFLFTAANESNATDGIDRIMDFEAGIDKIYLLGFLGDPPNKIAPSTLANGVGYWYSANGRLSFDSNGDGIRDFTILIVGAPNLTAADFLL